MPGVQNISVGICAELRALVQWAFHDGQKCGGQYVGAKAHIT